VVHSIVVNLDVVYRTVIVFGFLQRLSKASLTADHFKLLNVAKKVNAGTPRALGHPGTECVLQFWRVLHLACAFCVMRLRWPSHSNAWQGHRPLQITYSC
jgi:hypothetical protein